MNTSTADRLIGKSRWTAETRERIAQAAPYRSNVLISGPSGTGKELVARALHTTGPRAEMPFVPVNCAAIPHSLFDSQLFGHTKGAFTGAEHATLGSFRAAEGGTLFLDEIGELDLELQTKLLRVLQDREVTPVGSHTPVALDVRVVTATNRDLEQEVAEGRFRLDLYYRLNVIEIPTCGLRDRPEDIELLASHMLAKVCVENGLPAKQLTTGALELLEQHPWPGNVRELQNLMERAALLADRCEVDRATIGRLLRPGRRGDPQARYECSGAPAEEASPPRPPMQSRSLLWKTMDEVEREHIERTLDEVFYNQSAAARLLGIDRKRLARKISKFKLRATAVA